MNSDNKNNLKQRISRIVIILAIVLGTGFGGSAIYDKNIDTQQTVTENQTNTSKDADENGSGSSDSKNSGDTTDTFISSNDNDYVTYTFRKEEYLEEHFEKHGKEMGFKSAKEYEKAASDVVNNPDSLYKTEKEDGDYIYYLESTNEFVVVSTDGYIRTYYNPSDGIDYYNRK